MLNMTRFWESVKKTEAQLVADGAPDEPWIVSIETSRAPSYPGRVNRVTRRRAAELIVKGTHALASEDQVSQFRAEQERQRQRVNDAEAKREGRLSVPLPKVTGESLNG